MELYRNYKLKQLSISKLILIFDAVTDTQAYNVATSPYTLFDKYSGSSLLKKY